MGPRVYVEGITNYNPTAPENMETALIDFEKFANSDDQTDILVKVALIHYQFETIHPFTSGNGRIGRIIVNLFLQEKKILSLQRQ
ncbi:MAG: hypothetical protein PWQ67_338 [Clostridia bacterium]|jgi:Fic family protein|nr:hypothetical protein [Eubacteriaceae bacterium]MDN5321884.1 hypothetical protein [Clostridia bacterium]